jgi:hypothetical protein
MDELPLADRIASFKICMVGNRLLSALSAKIKGYKLRRYSKQSLEIMLMVGNFIRRKCSSDGLLIVTVTLLLTCCSPKPHQTMDPNNKKFSDAMAIALTEVAKYTKVPNCRSDGPEWSYSTREEGDLIMATLGPKNPKEPRFTVTMRKSDLAVVRTDRIL